MCMGGKPKNDTPPPPPPPPPPQSTGPLINPETQAANADAPNSAAKGRRRISIASVNSSGGSGLAS